MKLRALTLTALFVAAMPVTAAAQGCNKSSLISEGEMSSSTGGATIKFTQDYMIITHTAGAYTMVQTMSYKANGDSITYTIVKVIGFQGESVPPGANAGPHTVPCSLSGGTMKFGTATWSAF